MEGEIPGFVTSVHRALTEPILVGGAPRSISIVNGTLAAALASACASGLLYEDSNRTVDADAREILRGLVDRANRVLQLVEGFSPECAWLDDEETLTYLHSTVSTKRHRGGNENIRSKPDQARPSMPHHKRANPKPQQFCAR